MYKLTIHNDFYISYVLSQARTSLFSQLRDEANIITGIGFINRID